MSNDTEKYTDETHQYEEALVKEIESLKEQQSQCEARLAEYRNESEHPFILIGTEEKGLGLHNGQETLEAYKKACEVTKKQDWSLGQESEGIAYAAFPVKIDGFTFKAKLGKKYFLFRKTETD